jgi:hypothetical protein
VGVYFPNRAHSARIALKKLRYSAEIGELTGAAALEDSIRVLKKGLMEKLPSMATSEHPEISGDHVQAVVQALEAESRELHGQYVSRRDQLLDVCRGSEAMFASSRAGAARVVGVTAGVVALSAGAHAWRRHSLARSSNGDEVSIRIPIGHPTHVAG